MSSILRKVSSLDLEEQILNIGSIVALAGVCMPWMGGEWLGGESVTYSGFRFYTSFIGITVFGIHLFTILITLIPLTGGPVFIRKRHRETVRLVTTAAAAVLVLAALSVLTRVSFEFSRMEVRFGIYVSLIGCLIALLYAFLRYQEQRRGQVQELFHHPEDHEAPSERRETGLPPPPPPPPPPAPEPEEHRLHL